MDGIINVYKEKGYTSHDVVAKLRGILRMKKIGHTGTLDPEAEGVLPVCLGKGTRLCDMLTEKTKTYRAVMLLGVETDTQDATGTVTASHEEKAMALSEEQVREALESFLGVYQQVPPMYSALKVGGKKLYELARAGKEVERAARPVEILELQVEEICLPRVTFQVTCSKGTYIRTLCYDAGRKLGCGACMESLLRTRVERFLLEDSLTLAQIEALRDEGRVEDHVLPVDAVFAELPKAVAEPGDGDKLVRNGNPFPPDPRLCRIQRTQESAAGADGKGETTRSGERAGNGGTGPCPPRIRVYDSRGEFIGVYGYEQEKERYRPQKIFLGGR